MTFLKTITVETEVDISDDDLSDDDIIEIAEARGLSLGAGDAVQEIYFAFKFGLPEKAMELTRRYIEEVIGMVLP